jgi:hypothetical protein
MRKFLNQTDLSGLKNDCIMIESYVLTKTNRTLLIGGGLHDKLRYMTKEDCVNYILQNALDNKELLSVSFFSMVVNNNTMIGGDDVDTTAQEVIAMRKFLNQSDLSALKNECVAIQSYVLQKTNKTLLIGGGIHDKLRYMDKEACITYILQNALDNKELLNLTTFTSVVYPSANATMNGGDDVDRTQYEIQAMRKFLNQTSLSGLRNDCMMIESYVLNKTNKTLLIGGGIHDKLRYMDTEACVNYILLNALDNKELLNLTTFTSVVGPSTNKTNMTMTMTMFGGDDVDRTQYELQAMRKFLNQSDLSALKNECISIQSYVLTKTNATLPIGGGIHDRLRLMTKEDCITYILQNAFDNKELLNLTTFTSVVSDNSTLSFIIMGGLDDYLYREPRATLIQWALTAEKFDRNGKFLMGGLEDYINTMTNQQIGDYVMKMATKHTQLNSGEKLSKLAQTYGFTNQTLTE